MRILALTFPRLGIQLLRASSPEHSGRPLALLSGEGDSALVAAVSCEATKDGVEIGMTGSQARQRCPGITFERDNASQCLERLGSIASILKTRATTNVAIVSRNALVLDLDGMDDRFVNESAAAQTLLTFTRSWSGLDVRGAVGSDMESALEAARTARRFAVILPSEEHTARSLPRFDPVAVSFDFPQAASSNDATARLGRMAATLQALLEDSDTSFRKVTLEVARGPYRTKFAARPPQPIQRAAQAIEVLRERVPATELEGTTSLRLSLEAPGPAVAVEPWRSPAATLHSLPPAVPVQRRLRLAS